MTVKTKILGLQIGYESKETDTCHSTQPRMQVALEKIFTKAKLEEFSKESIKEFDAPPKDDKWVAEHIRNVINSALTILHKAGMKVRVHDDDLRHLAKGSDIVQDTGSHGTRCQQRGDRWVNSRSYRLLYQSDGDRWPKDRDPKDAFLFATLTWQCWPPVEDKR